MSNDTSCGSFGGAKPIECASGNAKLTVHGPSVCYKTIYPKPKKLNFGNKEINEVLQIEIDAHIRTYPDMVYEKLDSVKNKDGSVTYTLSFITKDVHEFRQTLKMK